MFKYFLFFVSIFSFLISDQVGHSYNSTIPSFTKTADPGRVSAEIINNNAEYKDVYVDDTSYGFSNLTSISEINYFGHDVEDMFQESGLNQINDFHFSCNTFGFNASYHGYNGMGYYASYEME